MRKVTVTLKVVLDIELPGEMEAEEVLHNMDYNFKYDDPNEPDAKITDTEILGWDVEEKS